MHHPRPPPRSSIPHLKASQKSGQQGPRWTTLYSEPLQKHAADVVNMSAPELRTAGRTADVIHHGKGPPRNTQETEDVQCMAHRTVFRATHIQYRSIVNNNMQARYPARSLLDFGGVFFEKKIKIPSLSYTATTAVCGRRHEALVD